LPPGENENARVMLERIEREARARRAALACRKIMVERTR
jgi:hypothetical protein